MSKKISKKKLLLIIDNETKNEDNNETNNETKNEDNNETNNEIVNKTQELEFNKNGKPSFWALGFYTLNEEPHEIQVRTITALERRVTQREIYLVHWDWMAQFPRYHHQGKTETSEWDLWIRFPKFRDLPRVTETYKINKGTLYFTEGVQREMFNFHPNSLTFSAH